MKSEVVITAGFRRAVKPLLKKYVSLKSELLALTESLENSPIQGEPLGKDCFKIRLAIASKGQGKSGGARIITCVKVVDGVVFALTVYDKSERENLAPGELDALLAAAGVG